MDYKGAKEAAGVFSRNGVCVCFCVHCDKILYDQITYVHIIGPWITIVGHFRWFIYVFSIR